RILEGLGPDRFNLIGALIVLGGISPIPWGALSFPEFPPRGKTPKCLFFYICGTRGPIASFPLRASCGREEKGADR
ncbi:MAG: hypothetical protein O6834_10615, partial [Actinobacteria bacterium]|nr:hypothetical protein [Actinomycetota bacterium]